MTRRPSRLRAFAMGSGTTRLGVVLLLVAVLALFPVAFLLAAPGPAHCAPSCGAGDCPGLCSSSPDPWLEPALLGLAVCFVSGLAIASAGAVYRAGHPEPIP
jgi:hypothetical protein